MFGCKDVIPPKFKDIETAWIGTDNASWFMRLKKRIQYWLAIGPRGKHWYCKTRELPKTLFAVRGKGLWRLENTDGSNISPLGWRIIWFGSPKIFPTHYLSRIQCWCQFHFAIQWPLFVQFHFIWKKEDVPSYPIYRSDFGIKKMVNAHAGYKKDGDRWHILTAFCGGNME